MPLLLVLELQVQELAQAAALVQVREPVQVRVLELARVQVQVRELVSAVEPLELELVSAVEPLEPEPVQAVESSLAQELVQQPELAAIPMQARELRVSRQLEPQQHRLPTAAQERPLYPPALPMKAPC